MGRSVSYLSGAREVCYFEWPHSVDEEDMDVIFEEAEDVINDIKYWIQDIHPNFERVDRWADREDHIILEGYGTQIGLSEYCGMATLSIRVDPDTDDSQVKDIEDWIGENWAAMSVPWNQIKRIGGFSNGESVYGRE